MRAVTGRGRAHCSVAAVEPYSALSPYYDTTLGRHFLRRAVRAFRIVARRFGLAPRVVADLGAGTGLFACWLARTTGARVYAVERSAPMLAIAARRAAGLPVIPVRQDIREMVLPEPVDLAIANYDTVNHLRREADVVRAFEAIRRAVRPGGWFLFDVITEHQSLQAHRYRFHCAGGVSVTQAVRFLPRQRTLRVAIHVRRRTPACVQIERHSERVYPLPWLGDMLGRAGFRVREVLDVGTLLPLDPGRPPARVLFVARRPDASTQETRQHPGRMAF